MRNLYLLFMLLLSFSIEVMADEYISVNNTFQNPYNNQLSAGGRNFVTESDIQNKGLWEQFLLMEPIMLSD